MKARFLAYSILLLAGAAGASAASAPKLRLSVTSLSFPKTIVAQTSAAKVVTLTNTGSAALSFSGITITGANPADFKQTTTCATTLAVNASCTLSVTFAPASTLAYSASISIADNAANSPQSIALTGTGVTPIVTLSASSLSFPTTVAGKKSATQSVKLTNTGSAPLTISGISLAGVNPADFKLTTTCGKTLAIQASCTISAAFIPVAAANYTASISIADNASNSPQSIALSGTGIAPLATLSASSISFPVTTVGATGYATGVTLTNTGNASLTISSIALTGAGAADFKKFSTCPTTLAAQASCDLSATFTPAAAAAYSASIQVTDNASGSPQTISLSGTGTSQKITRSLYVFPEANATVTPLYELVEDAKQSIDLAMWSQMDAKFTGYLVAACKRGVTVRVILDQNSEKKDNTLAFNQLNAAAKCSAVWANKQFELFHEEALVVDQAKAAITSLILQPSTYATTRDFALLENDPQDVAAIEATFNADYAAGTNAAGTVGASDYSYQPGVGDNDLIWGPASTRKNMLAFINNATKTLLIENGQMNDASTVSALEAACQRGVQTRIVMTNYSQYSTQIAALTAAGCQVYLYSNTSAALNIHAKAAVADYGVPTQNAFISSINYTYSSLAANRELGVYISDPASVKLLYTTMASDYAGSGVVVPAPLASLSSSSISFPDTMVSRTSAAQSITLTNAGSLSLSITKIALSGSNPSDFIQTNTCGTTLAASASCTLTVTFKPGAARSYSAYLLVNDNAPGSPQTIPLTGTGLAKAPLATLSASSINFQLTTVGKTNSATGVTLTNTGAATLDLSSISLTGANAAQFALASTCGSSLAVNASCSLSATFRPAAAAAYTAAISIASNAASSPQSITLAGTGTTQAITRSFYVFPEPDATVTPLYTLVNSAQSSIDMTMWALMDKTFTSDLVAACNRGVTVRVILDVNLEKKDNTPAYNSLNATPNCTAVWANPDFVDFHDKAIVVDGTQIAIMTLNLQPKCYPNTRDFAIIENDPADIADFETAFAVDYAAGASSSSTVWKSDYYYQPGPGDNDLIWSPTTANAEMLAFINNATASLVIENEEIDDTAIVNALVSACQRGVQTMITFTDGTQYHSEFATIKAAGCGLYIYPDKGEYSGVGFYVHTKSAVADYGLPTQNAFISSINYSYPSLMQNRDLGLYIHDQTIVDTLYETMANDFTGNGQTY